MTSTQPPLANACEPLPWVPQTCHAGLMGRASGSVVEQRVADPCDTAAAAGLSWGRLLHLNPRAAAAAAVGPGS